MFLGVFCVPVDGGRASVTRGVGDHGLTTAQPQANIALLEADASSSRSTSHVQAAAPTTDEQNEQSWGIFVFKVEHRACTVDEKTNKTNEGWEGDRVSRDPRDHVEDG